MWVGVEQDQNQEQILSGFGESNLRAESCSGNDGQLGVKRQKAETKSGPTEQLPKGWQRVVELVTKGFLEEGVAFPVNLDELIVRASPLCHSC